MDWLANILDVFNKTDIPFTLLFVCLFFYTIRANTSREHHLNSIIESRLNEMQEDVRVLMQIWKILLEKELNSQEGSKNDRNSN